MIERVFLLKFESLRALSKTTYDAESAHSLDVDTFRHLGDFEAFRIVPIWNS